MGKDQYDDLIYPDYQRRKLGLTKKQIEYLTSIYATNKKPTAYYRFQIAQKLGVPEDKVKNWFQNRRAKDRRLSRQSSAEGVGESDIGNPHRIYPGCNDLYRRRKPR
ncbi:uncharacterized protein VICG_00500 [Vittaforma corneae ATCC 50505]|uniref:Homeobox domain-containing protein n=1 Tax=Vittaforma corneae (strain ATCC 50505) TaxID=993615 RepID=L2GNI4_VITCO|nr:uncharacterized protein VICG_00500 [Vittaforma corneae ATCC 50505]ELA42401.1 hypothetical protein VICG_00500 [Vittaforma corneae ATCC 50505]